MKKLIFCWGVFVLSLKSFGSEPLSSLDMKSLIHQNYQSSPIFLNLKSDTHYNWEDLLNRIKFKGKLLRTEYNDFLFLGEPVPNDTNISRIASYVSAVGHITNNNEFLLERIDFVWENWNLHEDNIFTIEQWAFSFKPNGELFFEEERHLKIGLDSIIHSINKVETTTQEAFNKKRNLILKSWFEPNSM